MSGTPAANIARWNGTVWQPLGAGMAGIPSPVTDWPSAVVRPSPSTTVSSSRADTYQRGWRPGGLHRALERNRMEHLGSGVSGPVIALAVFNGELIAGGFFNSAGGTMVSNIARWNGAVWQPLAAGTAGSAGTVGALTIHGGNLIAGGFFASAGGIAVTNVARWDGSVLERAHARGQQDHGVRVLLSHGGELFAASTLWALPSGLTQESPVGTGPRGNPSGRRSPREHISGTVRMGIYSLASDHGAVLVGGCFPSAGGVGSPWLARCRSPPASPLLDDRSAGWFGNGCSALENLVRLAPGGEYHNLASPGSLSGGARHGPSGGLCAIDPMALLDQFALPIGAEPFHFIAAGPEASFGPCRLCPPGQQLEGDHGRDDRRIARLHLLRSPVTSSTERRRRRSSASAEREVEQERADQHEEEAEAEDRDEPREAVGLPEVHEERHHEEGLHGRDREGHGEIEGTQVEERGPDRRRDEDEQGDEHERRGRGRERMSLGAHGCLPRR